MRTPADASRSLTARAAGAAQTRQALLDAGMALAERTSLTELSVNRLVAQAGVSKGIFFHHFGDRASYLVALHRAFHERLLSEILAGIAPMTPGTERLLLAARIYLDACLRDRGVRALLLEARAEPAIAEEVRARNESTAKLCQEDFKAAGWRQPAASSRLWVGLVAEAALIELDAGRRKPDVRAALGHLLGGDT